MRTALLVLAALAGGCGVVDVRTGTEKATPEDVADAVLFNLQRVNEYRASVGVAPLELDGRLCLYARDGTLQEMEDHVPHAHFHAVPCPHADDPAFIGHCGENQGDPYGWSAADSVIQQVDEILAGMWAEGPEGDHWKNIADPQFRIIGIYLALDDDGRLYMTNDFEG